MRKQSSHEGSNWKDFLTFRHHAMELSIILSFILAPAQCELKQLCLNHEMQSLLAFKSGLDDPSGRLASWNASSNCCGWSGVLCSTETGHVVALDIHNSGSTYDPQSLTGSIHPALFELRDLEYLDVSSNNFI
ncbi:hypothetical protein SUGI_0808210 [Cryptomeria japonica]|nr:hypothetical protein SUGI_0808210 [Cryptomeria japonica]